MTVPAITSPSVALHDLTPAYKATPWASSWFTQDYVSGVPEAAVPSMVAQGWTVFSASGVASTTPPTYTYTMYRQGVNNLAILQQLVNDYTGAYNEGRQKNDLRYEDIVSCWSAMATATTTGLDAMGTLSNSHVSSYLTTLSGLVDVIDAMITTSLGTVAADSGTISAQLATFLAKLGDLESNYTAHLADIDAILVSKSDVLATYLSDYETELAKLETEYNTHLAAIRALETTATTNATNHIATYQVQVSALSSDFTSHNTSAQAYLTNLGTTELARINEKWDNDLANKLQLLVDRGYYSSALVTSVTTQNTRERNEEIAALNDKLNREKLDNAHKLYEQKVGMRTRTMQGLDQIYQVRLILQKWKAENESNLETEIANVRLKIAEGIDRRHTVQQAKLGDDAQQQDKELAELQGAVGGVLDGQDKYMKLLLQNSGFQVDARYKLMAQQMQADEVRLKGLVETHAEQLALMDRQMKVRNDLLIGLLEFMEKRTDDYPSLEKVATIASEMGDAGSAVNTQVDVHTRR